jgi:hypothetical protein
VRQQICVKAKEIWKAAENALGRKMYSTGVLLSCLVYIIVMYFKLFTEKKRTYDVY